MIWCSARFEIGDRLSELPNQRADLIEVGLHRDGIFVATGTAKKVNRFPEDRRHIVAPHDL
jgi:hypothetical protein